MSTTTARAIRLTALRHRLEAQVNATAPNEEDVMTTTTASATRLTALRHLLEAAVTGDAASMVNLVTDDVVGWSPNLFVRSRDELLEAFEGRDDTFSAIELRIRAADLIGDKAVAEWHLAVDHTGSLTYDGDLVVEPSGRRLHVSGATVAEFDGARICAFRSYFDDLALVEQLLGDD